MCEAHSEVIDPARLYRARLAVIDRIDELNLATARSRLARGQDIGTQIEILAENYERRRHLSRTAEA